MSVPSDFDALLSVDEVAARLGCSTRTVRRLAASGELAPGFRLRSLRRWRASDVDEYLSRLGAPAGEGGGRHA